VSVRNCSLSEIGLYVTVASPRELRWVFTNVAITTVGMGVSANSEA
jgi:hypothetical protein